ncbi:hypothetical protein ISN76_19510 [Dyella halodurans]|uniref:Alpha/beta hydrolase n=1 Tax=Dyella halodurans TaxID=1920171 RepID=A0ABV9C184_9GAMM|nr:hypothetical protein [Dyella halodurans]
MPGKIGDRQVSTTPLVLDAQGSFFVGAESVEQRFVELGGRRLADRITINQMYVEHMIPAAASETPVVMIHGVGLSGAQLRHDTRWAHGSI